MGLVRFSHFKRQLCRGSACLRAAVYRFVASWASTFLVHGAYLRLLLPRGSTDVIFLHGNLVNDLCSPGDLQLRLEKSRKNASRSISPRSPRSIIDLHSQWNGCMKGSCFSWSGMAAWIGWNGGTSHFRDCVLFTKLKRQDVNAP